MLTIGTVDALDTTEERQLAIFRCKATPCASKSDGKEVPVF